jgi:hypothetical protein
MSRQEIFTKRRLYDTKFHESAQLSNEISLYEISSTTLAPKSHANIPLSDFMLFCGLKCTVTYSW